MLSERVKTYRTKLDNASLHLSSKYASDCIGTTAAISYFDCA